PARARTPAPTLFGSMRKAILLYNPSSGRRQGRRLADVGAVLSTLREAGVEVSAAATRANSGAKEQVSDAITQGCDTVFACGGDGTIHDVLQGMVGTSAALGIIPLGTANSLAHDLGLPLSPARAAQAALTAIACRVAVGRVEYQDFTAKPSSRYFTVTAGIGIDGHLFYKLNPLAKRRLGMMAYYVKATRLWLTHKMELFAVEIPESGQTRRTEVSQLLAVRIRNFGGILRELAPGASLERNDFRLALFHTRSRAAYLCYVLRGLLGTRWSVPGIELLYSSAVACGELESSLTGKSRIFVEADGELLGTLPAEITIVLDGVNLLVPSASTRSHS
ncbi:MAG: YegS/Rv2252/BmrU family lipid kinase, partial [Terriglobales bacterium]